MKLLKKLEVVFLAGILSYANLVMAEELPSIATDEQHISSASELSEVNEEEKQGNDILEEESYDAVQLPELIVDETDIEEVVEESEPLMNNYATDIRVEKIKDFVQRLYINCLDREADEAGLKYWVDQLSSKSLNASNILENFLYSTEFKNKGITDTQYIKVLYRVCMDRASDEDGLNYWLGELQRGRNKNVLAGFVNSDEFTNICNSYGIEKGSITLEPTQGTESKDQVVNFVRRFYEKALGRIVHDSEISFWVDNLKNGTFTGEDIARNFILSDEFKNKNLDNRAYIEVLYTVLMDRTADESGLKYWLQQSKEQVLAGFIDSTEFTNICNRYGITKKKGEVVEDIFEYNKNRLIAFYKEYGIEIPSEDEQWNFFTSSNPVSFGAPREWDDEGAVFVSKYGIKDGIAYEEYRYGYCPKLNEGVLIVTENHYFKILKHYKDGKIISL